MGGWNVYNFECRDEQAVAEFKTYIEENHPTEFPVGEPHVFENLSLPDGGQTGADFAWTGRYLYVTTMRDPGTFLADTVALWERAVSAEMDSTTETCTEAVLYESVDGEAEKVVSMAGAVNEAGTDIVYRMAMEHQFRFRIYSAESPTTQMTPHASAFDFMKPEGEMLAEFAELTGTEPTEAGIRFLAADPEKNRTEGADEAPDTDETAGGTETPSSSLIDRLKSIFE